MKFDFFFSLLHKISLSGALICGIIATFDTVNIDYTLVMADEGNAEITDYCSNYSAFSERFVRPEFPQNAPEDVQRSWYALKKTCGRDLIKLSLAKWPKFEKQPDDVTSESWEQFIAAVEQSRFNIGEAIFDENHGGTLIKKYYFTDYEPDKIIALAKKSVDEVASIEQAMEEMTSDSVWKAERRAEFDLFFADFNRWFAPYCRASLDKLPDMSEYVKEPDAFLSTADLLEFAVDYISTDKKFVATLSGLVELLDAPKAVEIRVFHGRYEGFNLVSRDEIFARYRARIDAIVARCSEEKLQPKLVEAYVFNNRQTELFEHCSLCKWEAKDPEQIDKFYIVFPKNGPCDNCPLYVVLHSAGHSAKTALDCTQTLGNHDIYRVPDDFYGIFVDCYANKDSDWWWGGRRADEAEITDENAERTTEDLQPVEKRVLEEVAWAIEQYNIDINRVYLCGNSMGGSGTLGIGLRNGDIFAAIKANVPAGVWHAYDRLQLGTDNSPLGMAEPPVCFDYSAPNDNWSAYHEALFEGMEKRKYSYIAYWGNYGHENNDEKIAKYNDLFKTFDWTSIRKNEAYPVFTKSSVDSSIPWPERAENALPGQRGAFYRWQNKVDSAERFEIELRMATAEELKTKIFEVPVAAVSDVSVRRLQNFALAPNDEILWSFGTQSGKAKADDKGLITIPKLNITNLPTVLVLEK